MFKKSLSYVFALLIVASMVLAACQPAQTTPTEAPPVVEPTAATQPTAVVPPTEVPTPEPVRTTRKGGWLDEIVFSVVAADSALTQITCWRYRHLCQRPVLQGPARDQRCRC